MSEPWLESLVRQMEAERQDLIVRQQLIDGALEALERVYPGTITVPRLPADDADQVERQPRPRRSANGSRKARRAPAPTPRKGRDQGPARKAKPKTEAAAPPAAPAAVTGDGAPGLSGADRETLGLLKAAGGLMTGELAERTGLTWPGAQSRLQRLAAAGVAERGSDKTWRAK